MERYDWPKIINGLLSLPFYTTKISLGSILFRTKFVFYQELLLYWVSTTKGVYDIK